MKHTQNLPVNQDFPHSLMKEGRKVERKEKRKKHDAFQQLTSI
jgi:hypothetical protein